MTRVKELWQHGLNVILGHDCVQDPWYSLGTGNMLDVTHMAVHVCRMTEMSEIEACFNMVTDNGAKTLNLGNESCGIDVGKAADLIVLDADICYEAIRMRAAVRYVVSRGKLLAETVPAKSSFHGV